MKINLLELLGWKTKSYPIGDIQPTCECRKCAQVDTHNGIMKDLSTIDINIELDRGLLLHIIKDAYSDYSHERLPQGQSGAGHICDAIISNSNKIIKVVKK